MSKCASSAASRRIAIRSSARRGVWLSGLRRIVVPVLSVLTAIAVGAGGAYAAPPESPCPAGSFCTWPEENFTGQSHAVGLQATSLEQCVRLQQGAEARSFANNTGRPVTVYQDPDCDTEAEFSTYPTGSQNPRAAYVARAIKIWSH